MNIVKFFIDNREVSETVFDQTDGQTFGVFLNSVECAWVRTFKETLQESDLINLGFIGDGYVAEQIDDPVLYRKDKARDLRLQEVLNRVDTSLDYIELIPTKILIRESTGVESEVLLEPEEINDYVDDLVQSLELHGDVQTQTLFSDNIYREVKIFFNENFYAHIKSIGPLFEEDYGLDTNELDLSDTEEEIGDANEETAEENPAEEVEYIQAGFDLTKIKADSWKFILGELELSETPKLTQSGKASFWSWQGQDINLNTTHNPLTGEDSKAQGKNISDYAGYIGIIGDPKLVGSVVANLKEYGESNNFEDGDSTFLSPGTTKRMDDGKVTVSKGAKKLALKNDPKYKEWVERVTNYARQFLGVDKFPILFNAALPVKYAAGKTAGDVVYKWATNKKLTWLNNMSDSDIRRAMQVSVKESSSEDLYKQIRSLVKNHSDGENLIKYFDTQKYEGEMFVERSFNSETGMNDKIACNAAFCLYHEDHLVVKSHSLDRIVMFLESRFIDFDSDTSCFIDQVDNTEYRFVIE
jgi:hypothetical protein